MYLLSPKMPISEEAKGGAVTHMAPIIMRYQRIVNLLEAGSDSVRAHKKKLFGTDEEVESPDMYNTLSMCRSDGMPNYHEFINLDVDVQARIIAQYQLSNMVDLVQRHTRIVQENQEKLAKPPPAGGRRSGRGRSGRH